MRIAKVVGQITTNQAHPAFLGASLKLVCPLTLVQLAHPSTATSFEETLVAWDEFGCGIGSLVAISEGPEAARPFRPDLKPVDTYVAAILDEQNIIVPTGN